MTIEKCIEVLKALWRYKDCGYSEYEIRESLEMAIKTIEEQAKPTIKEKPTMKHCYEIYINKNNTSIKIQADKFELYENTLEFLKNIDKYTDETISVFNVDNILGFRKLY